MPTLPAGFIGWQGLAPHGRQMPRPCSTDRAKIKLASHGEYPYTLPMLTTNRKAPAMTILICDCNRDRACPMHAADLYGHAPVPVDTADTERRTFEDASADFYIPGWTPEDADTREHDRKILADMTAEAHDNPDYARALLALYPDDAFTAADLAAMRKHDAKDWGSNEGEV